MGEVLYGDRLPNFEALWTFVPESEGGRKGPPFQGYRPDVQFPGDTGHVWAIYPEFLAEDGKPLARGAQVPPAVRANMYARADELRLFYKGKIHVGLILRVVEGRRVVANAVVTEIKNLANA